MKQDETGRELRLDLDAFPNLAPPDAAYEVDEDELRRTLGELRARALDPASRAGRARADPHRDRSHQTAEESPARSRPAGSRRLPGSSKRRATPSWWWVGAAAVLLLWTSGWGLDRHRAASRLGEDVKSLEKRLQAVDGTLRQPRPNARVVTPIAVDDPLRGDSPAVHLGDSGATIVINESFPPGRYVGEIRTLDGRTVQRIPGLEPQPLGVSFYLPPEALPAGEYQVWLIGDDGAQWPTQYGLTIQDG